MTRLFGMLERWAKAHRERCEAWQRQRDERRERRLEDLARRAQQRELARPASKGYVESRIDAASQDARELLSAYPTADDLADVLRRLAGTRKQLVDRVDDVNERLGTRIDECVDELNSWADSFRQNVFGLRLKVDVELAARIVGVKDEIERLRAEVASLRDGVQPQKVVAPVAPAEDRSDWVRACDVRRDMGKDTANWVRRNVPDQHVEKRWDRACGKALYISPEYVEQLRSFQRSEAIPDGWIKATDLLQRLGVKGKEAPTWVKRHVPEANRRIIRRSNVSAWYVDPTGASLLRAACDGRPEVQPSLKPSPNGRVTRDGRDYIPLAAAAYRLGRTEQDVLDRIYSGHLRALEDTDPPMVDEQSVMIWRQSRATDAPD